MPHVDGALTAGSWTRGDSRFARPVAAITSYVRRVLAPDASAQPLHDRETRQREAGLAQAGDAHALERMQREDDRRDVRPWGWR